MQKSMKESNFFDTFWSSCEVGRYGDFRPFVNVAFVAVFIVKYFLFLNLAS